MDATEVIESIVKNLEPVVEPEYVKVIKEGYLACKQNLQNYLDMFYPPEERLEETVAAFVAAVSPDANQQQKEHLRQAFLRNYYGKESLASALGIDENSLNTAYTLAYASYNSGHYEEALNYFILLVFWDARDANFHFGLAATYHMLQNYKKALEQYVAAASLDVANPLPWFHMADCYARQENWEMAVVALRAVLLRVKNKPDFGEIEKKAKLLKNIASKRMQGSK